MAHDKHRTSLLKNDSGAAVAAMILFSLTGYRPRFIYDIRVQDGMAPPFFPTVQNFTCTTKDSVNNVSLYTAKPIWEST